MWRGLVRARGLARPLPLLVHDLVHPLARHLEMLSQPRLVPLREALSVKQVADGDPKSLRAFWVPLGHGDCVSVSHSAASDTYDARAGRGAGSAASRVDSMRRRSSTTI